MDSIAKEQPDWVCEKVPKLFSMCRILKSFFQTSISIAPKKSNWDLKREVVKKLERLEARTQRAIVEMMSKHIFFCTI